MLFKIKLILIFLFVFLPYINANANDLRCNQSKVELDCVIKFHESIYRDHPDYFWEVINKSRDMAYLSDTPKGISQYLKLLKISNSPLDLNEFLSEGLETLCVEKPILFKKARNLLDLKLRAKLNKKLNNPLYREKSELNECK